jgi:hypothetical protein
VSYLQAVLVADARRAGRAVRSALLRHRRIAQRPLGLVLWQLGAEPFTAAAVAWGFGLEERDLSVPGEPRNRELAFRSLAKLARAFNPWFERGGSGEGAPQIVVPNLGNLSLVDRLGRRLAYLPLDGPFPADPDLVRFGRHLRFLAERARHPGQQLALVLTDLLATHWTSELSDVEIQHLPALDAVIDPPPSCGALDALLAAERIEIGPAPSAVDDDPVDRLLADFHRRRSGSTDEVVVAALRAPLEAHYGALVDRGWPLLWRSLERERRWKEAPSVERRWKEDVEAHERHVEWVTAKGGGYRTRQTSVQAARTLRTWEEAERLRLAEEAIDDPLRMIPYLLTGEAVAGEVVAIDLNHVEPGRARPVRRPLVELATEEPCKIPAGRALFWTKTPRAPAYTVVEVRPSGSLGGSIVTLMHETSAGQWERPSVGQQAIFSMHHVHGAPLLVLPASTPWTHSPKIDPETASDDMDDDEGDGV